jgi:serine/threonine protein kinase
MEKIKDENYKRKTSFDCRQSANHFKLLNNQEHIEIKTFDSNYYKIIRQIGKGTYGEIYLVQDPNTLHLFALKKIIISDMLELRDNQEEYKLTWKLTHANPELKIVKKYAIEIKQLDKYNLVMYILMEAANCDWEQELLNRQKVKAYYTENEIMEILKSLVNTFAILQKKGISHRDVKPQNILCFGNEGYKLSDFGEAKAKNKQMGLKNLYNFEQNTMKQTLRGTELYMSPILFRALQTKVVETAEYNAYKSDVFSLGMCFLLASSLNYNSLFEIREVLDMKIIEGVINKYLGKLYSKSYINIIIKMLQVDERLRPDFIELSSALF